MYQCALGRHEHDPLALTADSRLDKLLQLSVPSFSYYFHILTCAVFTPCGYRPWRRGASAKVRVCDPILPSCSSSPFFFSFSFLFFFFSFFFSLFLFSRGVWRFSRPVPFWDWFGAASTRGPFPSLGKGLQASCSLRFSFLNLHLAAIPSQ